MPAIWRVFSCFGFGASMSALNVSPRQDQPMWKRQPDFAKFEEKPGGEGWLVNSQEGLMIQIKPDRPTSHAQFVLVSTYRLGPRRGQPIRQQRMLRHLGIEMWMNLQKIGWERSTAPEGL